MREGQEGHDRAKRAPFDIAVALAIKQPTINDTRLLSCPAVALMVVGGMLNYVDYLNNLTRDERMMHRHALRSRGAAPLLQT